MFKSQGFYHQHVRKAIIAFGTLFNNIRVNRTDKDGNSVGTLYVPLSYAPKQKFIQRIEAYPDVETRPVAVSLPRMGFELTSFTYDPSRKLTVTTPVRSVKVTDDKGVRWSFVSTPYNLGVSLSVFAKNQDDGLQIVEQILPYFNPDFNISINEIPELGVKRDIQIVLDNVQYNDDWEADFSKRLTVTWDLTFTMKVNFFGYIRDASVIRRTIENLYTDNGLFAGGPPTNDVVGEKITTEVKPFDALPSDAYTYITEFDQIFKEEL